VVAARGYGWPDHTNAAATALSREVATTVMAAILLIAPPGSRVG
jgi:hypothetical protein